MLHQSGARRSVRRIAFPPVGGQRRQHLVEFGAIGLLRFVPGEFHDSSPRLIGILIQWARLVKRGERNEGSGEASADVIITGGRTAMLGAGKRRRKLGEIVAEQIGRTSCWERVCKYV